MLFKYDVFSLNPFGVWCTIKNIFILIEYYVVTLILKFLNKENKVV